jgi:hypothetical protein
MSQMREESRRSTRVAFKVVIAAQGVIEPLTCDGETIVVNRHGALISSTVPLRMGLKIEIHVIITDKRAKAEVVFLQPERPFVCGIALDKPENIWGLSFAPDDWYETRETLEFLRPFGREFGIESSIVICRMTSVCFACCHPRATDAGL